MYNKSVKNIIVVTTAVIVVLLIGYLIASYQISRSTIKINSQNIKEAVVVDTSANKEVAKFKSDSSSIKLKKFKDYKVVYTSQEGYADGSIDIYTDDQFNNIEINPYLSRQKLDSLNSENTTNAVNDKILEFYPSINDLYNITQGKLFGMGDVYGVKLDYKGLDYYNTDSQKIVLVKKGNSWEIAGEPSIVLSTFSNPSVPSEILEEINNL